MKRILFISLWILLTLVVGVVMYAALVVSKKSPISTVTFNDQGLDLKVVYCQPYKNGRLIFGEEKDGALLPFGKYWRTGANAATEITFSKNINFAGQPVNAGSYRMYTVPGANSFQVSLNSELGVYFAVREPDYAKDVVKVDVPVIAVPSETEQFTISFGSDSIGVKMNLVWDKTQVTVPITAQ
jgi:uncharacterized membrane protein